MKNIRTVSGAIITAILIFVICNISFASGMEICYDGQTHLYTGSVYGLKVNGNTISSPMEPIIFNDHALVPVREIFEECGATVVYDGESRSVEVYYGRKYIRMYINNNVAYVNGQRTIIPDDVVPKLIYKPGDLTKTMVPVRFIAESAGMEVVFDGPNEEILIWSDKDLSTPTPAPVLTPEPTATPLPTVAPVLTPEPTVQPTVEPTERPTVKPTERPTVKPTVAPTEKPVTIKEITTKKVSDTSLKVTVKSDGDLTEKFSYFTLKSPERVVVDFKEIDYVGGDKTVKLNMNGITSMRTGVDEERTRIVIDVQNLKSYNVKRTNDNVVEISVTVTGEKAESKPTQKPTSVTDIVNGASSAVKDEHTSGISNASSKDKKKVIMLDAGHGGSDPGAIGELDGKSIYEKDLTLSITYKVKAILEEKGYAVSLTRKGDTLPTLAERPAKANKEGCALFVSIHINSATSKEAYGTEVFWSEENNDDDYNITSEKFAENVLNSMLKYMKSYNRGVRMANWAVTRRSEMPAVLVEVGFISNENELKKMCSDDYQNKTAHGIAEGIVKTLKKVEIPVEIEVE